MCLNKFGCSKKEADSILQYKSNHECHVSIVIPCYCAGSHISATLESVITQSFREWEVVLVDDQSKDDTLQIANHYSSKDSRIRVIQLEKNSGGPARPRNVGISQARGEWIAFLDSDDIWHPRKLEIQIEHMRKTGFDFSCTGLINFELEEDIKFNEFAMFETQIIRAFRQRVRSAIPNSSVIMRTEIARRFPLDERMELRAVEDYHCWLRILESGINCLRIEAPLLLYRVSDAQISSGKFSQMRKVFRVHSELPFSNRWNWLYAPLFTLTHVVGAIYDRVLRRRM